MIKAHTATRKNKTNPSITVCPNTTTAQSSSSGQKKHIAHFNTTKKKK